jgi:hypothetical protein
MKFQSPGHLIYRERWFCYLDLLGFKTLVRKGAVENVIPLYQEALNSLEEKVAPHANLGISHSWFSDSFIIFSRGDSDREFSLVEQAGRLFFQKLILRRIPVRGAITVGKLYSQLKRNIFIGEALIDAYEYGEGQDWLGFILTPHVYKRLEMSSLNLENRAHYRAVGRPVITHPHWENVYAFAFNNALFNGDNPYLDAVREMRKAASEDYKQKYINTEEFILKYLPDRIGGGADGRVSQTSENIRTQPARA